MTGTITPTTLAMRVRPPKITRAVKPAIARPVICVSKPNEVCIERLMVVAWTELKMRP